MLNIGKAYTSQQPKNICITFVQRRLNVFEVVPTLYKCDALCLQVCILLCAEMSTYIIILDKPNTLGYNWDRNVSVLFALSLWYGILKHCIYRVLRGQFAGYILNTMCKSRCEGSSTLSQPCLHIHNIIYIYALSNETNRKQFRSTAIREKQTSPLLPSNRSPDGFQPFSQRFNSIGTMPSHHLPMYLGIASCVLFLYWVQWKFKRLCQTHITVKRDTGPMWV